MASLDTFTHVLADASGLPANRPPAQAWLEVDLSAIRHNFALIRERIGTAGVYAVVKTDAYGHGLVEVAKLLDELGVSGYAVTELADAITIRQFSDKDILIMGYLFQDEVEIAAEHGFSLSLYDALLVPDYEEAARKAGKPLKVHLKVETGLNRLGVPMDEAITLLSTWSEHPMLELVAVYSHLAKSADRDASMLQMKEFQRALKDLPNKVSLHLTNTDAVVSLPEGHYDHVRLGLALYGVDEAWPGLRPCMSCKAVVAQVKKIKAGEGVSYGHLFIAERPTEVAVVALGYGEGYTQLLTGHAEVVAKGRRVPVIGKICMNFLILDVTGLGVKRRDEVTIIGSEIGSDGAEVKVTAAELARKSGLRHHEILTRLGASLPRVYSK